MQQIDSAEQILKIIYTPNEFGGRLKYFRACGATSQYWDGLWDKKSERLPVRSSDAEHARLPWFLRRLIPKHVQRGGSVLEAGCGMGGFTLAVAALGYQAIGIDFAPRIIERLQLHHPRVDFRIDNATHLQFASDYFDAVYSPGVCEHFEEGPDSVLKEAVRVLKPGGHLFVSAPCFNALRRYMVSLGRFKGDAVGEFYQYAFTQREISARLHNLGVQLLHVRLYGTMKTLNDHAGFKSGFLRGRTANIASASLDLLPITNRWGHCGLWIGEKL